MPSDAGSSSDFAESCLGCGCLFLAYGFWLPFVYPILWLPIALWAIFAIVHTMFASKETSTASAANGAGGRSTLGSAAHPSGSTPFRGASGSAIQGSWAAEALLAPETSDPVGNDFRGRRPRANQPTRRSGKPGRASEPPLDMEALEEPVTDPITGETIRPSDPHRRCGRCGARYTEASYRYVLEELGGRCQACRGYLEPHTGPSPDPSDVEDFFATEAERRLTREPRRRRSRRSAAARRNDPFDAEESALERGWGLLVDPTAPRNRQEALMILGLFEDATPREILDNYILLTRAWRSRDREEARDIVRMYLAAFDRALRFLMNNP